MFYSDKYIIKQSKADSEMTQIKNNKCIQLNSVA